MDDAVLVRGLDGRGPAETLDEYRETWRVNRGYAALRIERRELPLVLVHFMFGGQQSEPCPMCTLWADGYDGIAAPANQEAMPETERSRAMDERARRMLEALALLDTSHEANASRSSNSKPHSAHLISAPPRP